MRALLRVQHAGLQPILQGRFSPTRISPARMQLACHVSPWGWECQCGPRAPCIRRHALCNKLLLVPHKAQKNPAKAAALSGTQLQGPPAGPAARSDVAGLLLETSTYTFRDYSSDRSTSCRW